MKKALHFFMFLMAIVMMVMCPTKLWAQTMPTQGTGASDDPFKIGTAQELLWFAQYVNGELETEGYTGTHPEACAQLTQDIDLSTVCHASSEGVAEVSWTPIAKSGTYNINTAWTGTFNGDGKTISNLYINNAGINNQALFGYAGKNSRIEKLKMKQVYVKGNNDQAAVCVNSQGVIENVVVESGTVSGYSAVVGVAVYSYIMKNCINKANITAEAQYVAGVTKNVHYSVSGCSNYGTITSQSMGRFVAGIAVSSLNGATISDCANYGKIYANYESKDDECTPAGIVASPWNLNVSNCANFGNLYITGSTVEGCSYILGKERLKSVSGALVNSGKLYLNDVEQTGIPMLANGMAWYEDTQKNTSTEYTATASDLSSGKIAFILQLNSSEQAIWGQDLTSDTYPVIGGSTVYKKCGVEEYSNSSTADTHTSVTAHPKVEAKCLTDGYEAYWECDACHMLFADEAKTMPIPAPVAIITTIGYHTYDLLHGKCSVCNEALPVINAGTTNNMTIPATKNFESYQELMSDYTLYYLYKFTPATSGKLTVALEASNASLICCIVKQDGSFAGIGNNTDAPATATVAANTTYYIGIRTQNGKSLEGLSATLTIADAADVEKSFIFDFGQVAAMMPANATVGLLYAKDEAVTENDYKQKNRPMLDGSGYKSMWSNIGVTPWEQYYQMLGQILPVESIVDGKATFDISGVQEDGKDFPKNLSFGVVILMDGLKPGGMFSFFGTTLMTADENNNFTFDYVAEYMKVMKGQPTVFAFNDPNKFLGKDVPSVTLNAAGFATYSADVNTKVATEGVKAYYATIDGDNIITLSKIDGDIPEGDGAVLYGTPGTVVAMEASNNTADFENNILKPTTTYNKALFDVPTSGYTFVMNKTDNLFHPYTGTTFAANRAYINLNSNPVASGAKGLSIVFDSDVTTSIGQITSLVEKEGALKVIENGKMVIIKNGKKYNTNGQEVK